MLFSSTVFLTLFLPAVLLLYFALGRRARNPVLLAASLCFYAWGETFFVALMLVSIAANYGFGLWIDRARDRGAGRLAVGVAVAFNLGLLIVFKYTNWLWSLVSDRPIGEVLGPLLEAVGLAREPLPDDWGIRLPLGISFFTFQAMSYLVDVYRRQGPVQRNPLHFGVYIALFPQLVAGPIIRYRDVAQQIVERVVTLDGFAWGIRRFVIGLGKKMLVANVLGQVADGVFGTQATPGVPVHELSAAVAWLGVVTYALQIYFDFSGYSDMAIGLGRMFGFRFLENFDYPYISRSITEFWRRWHISLSFWFRDYLYTPLGGNRKGALRTYLNLVTVFFLCGLWHGASWNFVLAGMYHGVFLVIERMGLGAALKRVHPALRHGYFLLVLLVGWVFFRSTELSHSVDYLAAMFGMGEASGLFTVDHFLNPLRSTALVCALVGSLPWLPRVLRWRADLAGRAPRQALELCGLGLLLAVFAASVLELAAGTYNPFIYFRF